MLVQKVYVVRDLRRIMVISVNGSMILVDIVDPKSCATGQHIEAFTEGVAVKGPDVEIQPGCECGVPDEPCSCSSAEVLQMKQDGKLYPDLKKSDALTLRALG